MLSNPAQYATRNGLISEIQSCEDEEDGVLTKAMIKKFFEEALKTDANGNPVYPYGAGAALQLATGCRSGELRALTWDNIKDGVIYIRHSVSRVENLEADDTTGKKSSVYISNAKSKSSRREIPYSEGSIISECLEILRKRCENIPNENNLVMPTSTGGYLTSGNYNKVIKRISHSIVIGKISSHALRHSFISLLVNDENRDLATIASLAGHGDIRVTLQYAKHTDREKKKETLSIFTELADK